MEREEVMIRTDWEKVLRDSTSVVAEHQWQSFLEHGEVTWSGPWHKPIDSLDVGSQTAS